MAKKISERQFVLDCINKEFEIIGSDKRFSTFEELSEFSKANPKWFDEYSFEKPEDEILWKEFCLKHFYNWKSQHTSKRIAQETIGWLALDWGFKTKYNRQNETD